MALQFGVSYAGSEYEWIRIRRWPFNIGRNPKSDLCLTQSELISRNHARVFREADGCYIVALGKNPSFLNGELLAAEQPRKLAIGDVIELPDYRLELRNAVGSDDPSATINVEIVSASGIVVRRIASAIGTRRWTIRGIHEWLAATRNREIRVRHEKVTLCLHPLLPLEELTRGLELFANLVASLDPQKLAVEVIEPSRARAAGYASKTSARRLSKSG